jgi:hypothetical protein
MFIAPGGLEFTQGYEFMLSTLRGSAVVYYITRITITAALIVLISELSKRSSFVGALLASVPLVSVLAILWLYLDTGNVTKVSELASSIFWLVLPSLALFITLPVLLAHGFNFYLSLLTAIGVTAMCYGLMLIVLRFYGVQL